MPLPFVTYQDMIDQLVDYLGGNPSDVVQRDCRRAIQEAYRDFANSFRWSYLLAHGRILTVSPYREGTVAYDSATRTVWLSDGTWPAWAAGAYMRVGFQGWKVIERRSGAALILDAAVNPGQDVDYVVFPIDDATPTEPMVIGAPVHGLADGDRIVVVGVGGAISANGTWTVTVVDADHVSLDGSDGTGDADPYVANSGTWRMVPTTPFTLYRDAYIMPEDYVAQDQALYEQNFGGMAYVHPREWLFEERFVFAEGTPQWFTIMGDPIYPGRLVLRLAPHPLEVKTVDFLYHRRPRPLTIATEQTGRVTVAAQSATVAGIGTAFHEGMVGAVLRLSAYTNRPPTSGLGGFTGMNPAIHESLVVAVDSPTVLRLADVCPVGLAGVLYTISDPVDFELGAMSNAFSRCCEFHISLNRTLKDKPSARQAYLAALAEARSADSRIFSGRAVGDGFYRPRQRLRDMPISFAEET